MLKIKNKFWLFYFQLLLLKKIIHYLYFVPSWYDVNNCIHHNTDHTLHFSTCVWLTKQHRTKIEVFKINLRKRYQFMGYKYPQISYHIIINDNRLHALKYSFKKEEELNYLGYLNWIIYCRKIIFVWFDIIIKICAKFGVKLFIRKIWKYESLYEEKNNFIWKQNYGITTW